MEAGSTRSVTVIASEGQLEVLLVNSSSPTLPCVVPETRGAPLFWKGKRSRDCTPELRLSRGRSSWSPWVRPVVSGCSQSQPGGWRPFWPCLSLQDQWWARQVWRRWSSPQYWRSHRAGQGGFHLAVRSLPQLSLILAYCQYLFILKANSLFANTFLHYLAWSEEWSESFYLKFYSQEGR